MSSDIMWFQKLVEAVPDALVGMDQNGVIRFVSRQTELLFGYDRDLLIGQHIDMLVPETLWQVYAQHRAGYFADPRTRSIGLDLELSGQHSNGDTFPINISLSTIDTGDVLLVITAAGDVAQHEQVAKNIGLTMAVVESADDAIIGTTSAGTITSWNPAAERMYGYLRNEVLGRHVGDLLAPADRADEARAVLDKIRAGQHVEHLETERVRRDGTMFQVSITVAPIRGVDGDVVGASAIHRDVTEQRQAFETAQRMAAIVEDTDDAIIGASLDGTITSWNPAAEGMFGYTCAEIVGKSAELLTPQDRKAEIRDHLVRVGAGQHVENFETERVRKDGTVFPASVTLSPICDAGGVIVGASAIAHDVTEQKKAFEATQQMAAIVEGSDDAIFASTLKGTITSWNKAAERLFGYTGQEMIGTSGRRLSPKDRTDEIKTILAKVGAGQRVDNLETERVRKDGTVVPVSLTVSPIRDQSGAVVGASAIGRNMTELRRAALYTRGLIEADPDPLGLIGLDGTVLDLNEATVKAVGIPRDELIGTDFSQYWTDPDKAREGVMLTLAQGSVTNFPLTARSRDGTLMDALCNARLYRDINGDVLGVLVAARDVTERKRAEQAVARERDLLRATMDSLMDPRVLLEAVRDEAGQIVDFVYVDANPTACAYNGMDHEHLVGTRLLDLQPGSVGYGLLDRYVHVVETGEPLVQDDIVYAQELRGGQERHYDVRATRVGDGLSYSWRDVTDRHVAAQWLAESEEHFRLLAENASDVVMRLGPDRRFEWVSGSVADVLGWAANDLLGHLIDEFIHPEEIASFRQSVASTSPECVASTEFRFRRADGNYRWVLCHTRLNTNEDSTPVALVGGLVDIEARKAVEAHEADRLETLERFQRLTLGRELKMIELKKEIERLRSLVHKDGDEKGYKH